MRLAKPWNNKANNSGQHSTARTSPWPGCKSNTHKQGRNTRRMLPPYLPSPLLAFYNVTSLLILCFRALRFSPGEEMDGDKTLSLLALSSSKRETCWWYNQDKRRISMSSYPVPCYESPVDVTWTNKAGRKENVARPVSMCPIDVRRTHKAGRKENVPGLCVGVCLATTWREVIVNTRRRMFTLLLTLYAFILSFLTFFFPYFRLSHSLSPSLYLLPFPPLPLLLSLSHFLSVPLFNLNISHSTILFLVTHWKLYATSR